jgi:hypothetical protein
MANVQSKKKKGGEFRRLGIAREQYKLVACTNLNEIINDEESQEL